MGSKRKIADKIVDHILEHNPNCKYVYDLFGGGGAISFELLQRKQIKQVFYNELNTGVVELLKHIRNEGITDDMYKWVSREEFFKHKDGNDWYAGFVKTVYSFGNNPEKGYLFGKDIEEIKRQAHEIVLNKDLDCLVSFNKHFGTNLNIAKMIGNTINDRRLQFQRILTEQVKDKKVFKGFCVNEDNSMRNVCQQLERLQQLEQLEQLEISNLSYEQVPITTPIDETIIYLDPPYKGTEKYQCDINHDDLLKYIKESPHKIYVSGYEMEGLHEVFKTEHRSILSSTANNKVIEKMFCNRKESSNTKIPFSWK